MLMTLACDLQDFSLFDHLKNLNIGKKMKIKNILEIHCVFKTVVILIISYDDQEIRACYNLLYFI